MNLPTCEMLQPGVFVAFHDFPSHLSQSFVVICFCCPKGGFIGWEGLSKELLVNNIMVDVDTVGSIFVG